MHLFFEVFVTLRSAADSYFFKRAARLIATDATFVLILCSGE